jgi:Rhs element Vgr protein
MADALRAGITISVGGAAQNDMLDGLIAVTVDSSLHLPAMATVELFDDDQLWINDTKIELGKPVEITFEEQPDPDSTESPLKKLLFQGEITSIEPRFNKDGRATMLFRAYDKSHRLHRGKQSRTFLDSTDSDVVSTIAKEAGLTADVDTTKTKYDYLVQTNQTDMEFLQERARRIGYWAFAAKEKLSFKKADSKLSDTAGPDLEWPEMLREFRPRLSGVGQPKTGSAQGWDFKAMKEIEGKATTATKFNEGGVTKAAGAAADTAFAGDGKANIAIVHRPMAVDGEATEIAQAALNDAASEFLQAEGECLGHADILAGVIVNVKGVGTRFEGKYLVTAATHIYKRGQYTTRFAMTGRQPNTFRFLVGQNRNTAIDRPQAEVNGVVVGVVTNADDKDNLGRVKVKFPWLPKDNKGVAIESAWARISAPMAGSKRGFMFMPAVNDEVLVAFEHGDPNTPYVLGGLWNSKDTPPLTKDESTKTGKTQQHMIKTQSGHVLIFDDKDGEEQIIIRDKSTKNEIIITTKDKSILINAEKDIKLTAGGKIMFKATDDILLESKDFKVKTTADFDVESVNAKVKASGNVTLEGAKIEGKGTGGVTWAAAGVGKIEITSAKTSINAGGLDVM